MRVATSLGIALIATSGYLISRAAQRPPVLALTVTIVIVRFLGLTRPLARYIDRLVSHDLALRSLGTIRSRFFARIEPLAPGQLDGFRRGDLVARMVGDVDRLDGLYVRGLCPPLSGLAVAVLCVVAATVMLPAAGAILAAGLAIAGLAVPALAARWSREPSARLAAARAQLSSQLVELLRAAPEIVAFGAAGSRADGGRGTRPGAGSADPARCRPGRPGRRAGDAGGRPHHGGRAGRGRAGAGERIARPRAGRDRHAARPGVVRGGHTDPPRRA